MNSATQNSIKSEPGKLRSPSTSLTLDIDLINKTSHPVDTYRPKMTYGWIRDLPDKNCKFFMAANSVAIKKFPKTKIITSLPDVYNQGDLGSCTANALGAAFSYEQKQRYLQDFKPSRLFIYYNERKLQGNTLYDTGSSISDGIKALTTKGVCPEELWPYDVNKFAVKPPKIAYEKASLHQVLGSRKVPETVNGFKTMINMQLPVIFGFTAYESFEKSQIARTGIMTIPTPEEKCLGGHAVLCVGYDDDMRNNNCVGFLKIRNSWGDTWGDDGYFWMPYDYVDKLKLVSDLWVITKNEGPLVVLNKELSTMSKMRGPSCFVSNRIRKIREIGRKGLKI